MTAPVLDMKHYRSTTTLTLREAQNSELPAGVCGQIEGIALVYDVIDDRGTTFARGCLDRTIRERVNSGRVKLYVDHGDALLTGVYDTHLHIGTVREMWDAQEPNGQWVNRFRADIFDTEAGRKEHEYLKAVAVTGSETGVSIGMLDAPKTTRASIGGYACERINEVPLREISVTGEPSVPGTKVTRVRQSDDTVSPPDYLALLDGLVAHLGPAVVRAHLSPILSDAPVENSDADKSAPLASDSLGSAAGDSQGALHAGSEPDVPDTALMSDRMAFVRAHLQRLL